MSRHVRNPRQVYTPPPLDHDDDDQRGHRVETTATIAVLTVVVALIAAFVWVLAHWGWFTT